MCRVDPCSHPPPSLLSGLSTGRSSALWHQPLSLISQRQQAVCSVVTMLLVYAPASEYILALKITAERQKDLDDCAILLPTTEIRKRKQAQQVLDRYIFPSGQRKNAESIENALNRLFGREG